MKTLVRRIKEEGRDEQGAIMVISALVMTIMLGFAAFAIDISSWRATQTEYQNAADAAAMMAASKRYKTGVSQEEATKFAFQAASLNDLTLDNDEMTVTYDDSNKKVNVVIRKPTQNYFSTSITGKDETMISAESSAGLDVVSSEDEAPFGANAALEALGRITWSGGSGCLVNGGAVTGNALTITSGVAFKNGDVSADDDMTLSLGGGLTVDGSIFAGKNLTLTAPGTVFNGKVETIGNFTSNNGGSTYNNDILANGKLFVGADKIYGNVYGNQEVYINAPGCYIQGDVKSNKKTTINGGSIPTIDGVWYQRGNLYDYQKNGMKNSSGQAATIKDGTTQDLLPDVQHGNYKWHWEKLEDYLAYDSSKSDADQPYTVVDDDMFNNYVQDKCDGLTWKAQMGHWNGNFEFWSNSDIGGFLDYCREHGKGDDYPLYFPGSVTLNQGGNIQLNGTIIVEKDFTYNTQTVHIGTSSDNPVAIVSRNGNITLGNSGGSNVVNGAVIDLNPNGNIQMNGGGTIYGGVVSKGTITMNGKWDVTANTKWQQSVQPVQSSTKVFVRLKK